MISEEKMTHIVHLIIDGIWKLDMVDYPDEDAAMREAKRVSLEFIRQLNTVGERVAKRIRGLKNPPFENSPQWDILYQKYLEEELNKQGRAGSK